MGLSRHDGEVESVVMDDAVLVLGVRVRARYVQAHEDAIESLQLNKD